MKHIVRSLCIPAALFAAILSTPAHAETLTFHVIDDGAIASTCTISSNFASEEVGYGNFLGLPPAPCFPDPTITDNREHAQQALGTFDLSDLSAPGGMYWKLDWAQMNVHVWAKQQLNEIRHLGFCWGADTIEVDTSWDTWPRQGWQLPAGAPSCATGVYTQTFIPGGQIGALHWGTQTLPLGAGSLASFQQAAEAAYGAGGDGRFSMTMFIGTPGVASGQLNIGDALISLENVGYTCGAGTPNGPCPQGDANQPEAMKITIEATSVMCLEGTCGVAPECQAAPFCDVDNGDVCVAGEPLTDDLPCSIGTCQAGVCEGESDPLPPSYVDLGVCGAPGSVAYADCEAYEAACPCNGGSNNHWWSGRWDFWNCGVDYTNARAEAGNAVLESVRIPMRDGYWPWQSINEACYVNPDL